MPHLYNTVEGESLKSQATGKPPFGPGFSDEQIAEADRMEVWASSFSDPGEDYTEFRLMKKGQIIHRRCLGGY